MVNVIFFKCTLPFSVQLFPHIVIMGNWFTSPYSRCPYSIPVRVKNKQRMLPSWNSGASKNRTHQHNIVDSYKARRPRCFMIALKVQSRWKSAILYVIHRSCLIARANILPWRHPASNYLSVVMGRVDTIVWTRVNSGLCRVKLVSVSSGEILRQALASRPHSRLDHQSRQPAYMACSEM